MAGLYYVVMIGSAFASAAVIALVLSVALVLKARKQVAHGVQGRTLFLFANAVAPFIALAWIVIAVFIHIHISNRWAHQDCGFSGDPYVTLPNGYVVGSLNTYSGYVVAPGFHTDQPITGQGYVRSLIDIELKGNVFVGTVHNFNTNEEWNFTFHTQDRRIETSNTGRPISFEETQNRVHQDPNSYWVMYNQYRHRWPVVIFLDLIAFGGGLIVYGMRKLWQFQLAAHAAGAFR